MPHYLKPVAEVAYITGWRTKSELLTRQWRHVDLANGWTPACQRTAKAESSLSRPN
jgi:hypothetical protein